jgi:hypothetical protein
MKTFGKPAQEFQNNKNQLKLNTSGVNYSLHKDNFEGYLNLIFDDLI